MRAKSCLVIASLGVALSASAAQPFNFQRDTFGFANMTVFEYENGIAHLRRGDVAKQERYTRRCFVLSRAVWQFRKFARFDVHAPPLDDRELIARIRAVTRRQAWKPELPEKERIVFPYADLREIGYLTTLPRLSINHAVLVYAHKDSAPGGMTHYLAYDSNHPEGPRELTWLERDHTFSYQNDWDFVGGPVRVYQVYGKPFQ